jgi:hypothetical protein
MLERSGVASNGFVGCANPRALAEPGKCSMTMNGHDNEGLTSPGRELCEVYCRLHNWGSVQRHRSLQTASKLSILHKGRFKG